MNQTHSSRRGQPRVTELSVTQPAELLAFLLTRLPQASRRKAKLLLAHGQVSVQGSVVTQYNHALRPGDTVQIGWGKVEAAAGPANVRILFEDEHLIVVDKPAGLLTMATPREKEHTAYRQLMDHLQRGDPAQRVYIVHRLDRDTSGVLLFAKNADVQEALQTHWRDAVQERTYAVLVEGRVRNSEGTVTSWLKESRTLQMVSSRVPNGGQKAITHYSVLQATDAYSLLQVRLETGRKNQIRVHMQDLGHSVVGDRKYGARGNPLGRLGLHAQILAFVHPTTRETLRFETEIPKKFRALLL